MFHLISYISYVLCEVEEYFVRSVTRAREIFIEFIRSNARYLIGFICCICNARVSVVSMIVSVTNLSQQ